ncbi:MAG: hypothetical protein QM296_12720 [Bacillota bacterium]|nr:hypothetical protein [Bacillota bacterium]
MRWCPEFGAGTKKLTRGGQKMRWCPENGAGTKKLSTVGQKLRWCPENGAGTKKLATPFRFNWRCSTTAFYFYSLITSGGKRINRKQSYERHLPCCHEEGT